MSDVVSTPALSKKRDATSPLQAPCDTNKKSKNVTHSNTSLSDIGESSSNTDISDISDLSDSETNKLQAPSPCDQEIPAMASNLPRLSDEDVDRIALRVQTLMMPQFKSMLDSSIGEVKREFDNTISGIKSDYDNKIHLLESVNYELKSELCHLRDTIHNMKMKDDEMEQYSRRNSVLINGISESDKRPTDEIVLSIANQYNINISIADIDRSHRIGKEADGKARAVLVKFVSYRARNEFMRKKQDLANGIYFNEHLTPLRSEILYKARRLFKEERLFGAWSLGWRVFVKDTTGEKHEVMSIKHIESLASRTPVKRPQTARSSAASRRRGADSAQTAGMET